MRDLSDERLRKRNTWIESIDSQRIPTHVEERTCSRSESYGNTRDRECIPLDRLCSWLARTRMERILCLYDDRFFCTRSGGDIERSSCVTRIDIGLGVRVFVGCHISCRLVSCPIVVEFSCQCSDWRTESRHIALSRSSGSILIQCE